MVDQDSGTTTYTYHDNNWLKTLTNPNSEVTTWAYTNIGLVSTLSLNSGSVTTYVYDAAGQATGITHKKANETIIEQIAYTYDNAGNRKTVTENSGDVTTWTYDNANQLTVEQRGDGNAYHITYACDSVGNCAGAYGAGGGRRRQ